jgi:hypothetical protein
MLIEERRLKMNPFSFKLMCLLEKYLEPQKSSIFGYYSFYF